MARFRILAQRGDDAPQISPVQEAATAGEVAREIAARYADDPAGLPADVFEIVEVKAVLRARCIVVFDGLAVADGAGDMPTPAMTAKIESLADAPRQRAKRAGKASNLPAEPAAAAEPAVVQPEPAAAPEADVVLCHICDAPATDALGDGRPVCVVCLGPVKALDAAADAEFATLSGVSANAVAQGAAAHDCQDPPVDETVLKARRADARRACIEILGAEPCKRMSAHDLTQAVIARRGFAALPPAHVAELVQAATGGDEFAHLDGTVCLQPLCSQCRGYAVPGGLSRRPDAATLCLRCLEAQNASDASPPAADPRFCPHCAVTATQPANLHGPACPLRREFDAQRATPAAPEIVASAVIDLGAVVPTGPAWRVDVAGDGKEIVTVSIGVKSYWQRYAGPRTAQREALALHQALEAGADVADKLSRMREGTPQ